MKYVWNIIYIKYRLNIQEDVIDHDGSNVKMSYSLSLVYNIA